MIVGVCKLPGGLAEALRSGRLQRSRGSWRLRSDRDHAGQRLQSELGEVFQTPERIVEETAALPEHFRPNGIYGRSLAEAAGPGAIPDIVDFTGIICFGMSADGAPFCLDYRESPARPQVIWWDDVYWRVVAPDFDSFLDLFDLESESQ